jgi:hypothetical protein
MRGVLIALCLLALEAPAHGQTLTECDHNWTIGPLQPAGYGPTMRDGTWVGGGLGVEYRCHEGAVFVLGGDAEWWEWDPVGAGRWQHRGAQVPGYTEIKVGELWTLRGELSWGDLITYAFATANGAPIGPQVPPPPPMTGAPPPGTTNPRIVDIPIRLDAPGAYAIQMSVHGCPSPAADLVTCGVPLVDRAAMPLSAALMQAQMPPDCTNAVVVSVGSWQQTAPPGGAQGWINFSLLQSARAIERVIAYVDLTEVYRGGAPGADLRRFNGIYVPLPTLRGTYRIRLEAYDSAGCMGTDPRPMTVTVQ